MVGGGELACCHHGDHLPPTDRSELCTGQQHTQICQDLSNSKNMGFNVKKTAKQQHGPDDTAKGTEKNRFLRNESRSCGFTLPKADVCQQLGQCQCLTKAFETAFGPLGPEDVSVWQILHLSTPPGPPSSSWQNSGLLWIGHHIPWT